MSINDHLERTAAKLAELNHAFAKIITEAAVELRYGRSSRWEVAERMDAQLKEARETHKKK
jgi:hypothetical protein